MLFGTVPNNIFGNLLWKEFIYVYGKDISINC